MCHKDGFVCFHNSILMCGNLGKVTLGSGNKNGLFYRIIHDTSPKLATKIMSRFAKLSARWLTNFGMTIGISDVTPSRNLYQENEKEKDTAIVKCMLDADQYVRSMEKVSETLDINSI